MRSHQLSLGHLTPGLKSPFSHQDLAEQTQQAQQGQQGQQGQQALLQRCAGRNFRVKFGENGEIGDHVFFFLNPKHGRAMFFGVPQFDGKNGAQWINMSSAWSIEGIISMFFELGMVEWQLNIDIYIEIYILVGGLEHFLFFHILIYWEYSSQLTNIFQRDWNHQPVYIYK